MIDRPRLFLSETQTDFGGLCLVRGGSENVARIASDSSTLFRLEQQQSRDRIRRRPRSLVAPADA